jgi:hypothetical protein
MKKKIYPGKRQKNVLKTKATLVFATVSIFLTMTGGILVYLNLHYAGKSRATATGGEGGGNDLSKGEIIAEFNWDNDPVTTATLGPDGIKVSKDAHSMQGGVNGTSGLSAGEKGKNIDLEVEAGELFRQDGIDISIDFRRNEPSGNFFTRGNMFNFGIDNGFLCISYQTENKLGRPESVRALTNYEVPLDPVFRTYRFIYMPTSGKAELFVNNVIVWQKQHEKNSVLNWKNAGNIIIGENMNGGGTDKAIFDNLVIRSTESVAPLAESLLNFMLEANEGTVKVHWSTSVNDKVDYFTIERSTNGVNFENVANVKALADSLVGDEYVYTDKSQSSAPLVYYRLRQTFKNGKFVTHALSAIKSKYEKGLAIDRISQNQLKDSYNISYYLPKSGRVWLQIADEQGKIISTKSFEAPQGKNVHVLKDESNLNAGTYIISLIFDNKKTSTKIVKG